MATHGAETGDEGFEDGYWTILQVLEETGWESTGTFTDTTVGASYYRQPDKLGGGSLEATTRLGLLDQQGMLLPGFKIDLDDQTDTVVIEYDGARDTRFGKFVEGLLSWGEELAARQDAALASDSHRDRAQELFGALVAQVAEEPVVEIAEVENETREEVIANLMGTPLSRAVKGLDPWEAIEFLQTLFALTAKEQDHLLSDIMEKPEAKNQVRVLDGIARGVQRELILRREVKALENAHLVGADEETIAGLDDETQKFIAQLSA